MIYGEGSVPFYLFQTFTALILFLAANTSYNAFPRLAAILALDGYMPRQFSFRGDRLAFTSGVVILSLVAISLLLAFGGQTHALIPLYSVGVFVAFTVGQSGMIVHWLRERPPGWQWRLAINTFGCVLTGLVAVVVMIAKAPTSLLVIVVIPLLVGLMLFINRQYRASKAELAVRPDAVIRGPHREERVIVPVPGINRAVVHAVNVGLSIDPHVQAVLISDDPEEAATIRSPLGAPAPGGAAGHRRVAVSSARRAVDLVPRRPGPRMAGRQGGPDHLRRHPGVRGEELVGADPVQPVGQAASSRAPGSRADRRRQRAVPA